MTRAASLANIEIRGLCTDSREAAPGYLFVALRGIREDGRRYIDNAIENGAVAVLAETGTTLKARVVRQPHLTQRAGETQTMDQPEGEGHQPGVAFGQAHLSLVLATPRRRCIELLPRGASASCNSDYHSSQII
jgi:UDP-N-acetylmuramyl pentapeptide synthase